MKLSKRLEAIAGQVLTGARIVDIGTDHGYVPIYLFEKKIIKNAIATDINKGPIEKARENIKQYNAEHNIELRLGNGLENINKNEVDTLILAGMGGMLIIDILGQRPDIVQSVNRIIIQPQLDSKEVRKYLHKINFNIINEQIVYEDNKYYFIITAVPGKQKYSNEKYYRFSKALIESKNPILKDYIEQELIKLKNILKQLKKATTNNTLERICEIEQEIKLYEEVWDAY